MPRNGEGIDFKSIFGISKNDAQKMIVSSKFSAEDLRKEMASSTCIKDIRRRVAATRYCYEDGNDAEAEVP